MKRLLIMAVFGLAGLAAFAGTCVITHISLLMTNGTNDTFAGQLDNTSGVNILQHNFVIAFLDVNNNVVDTRVVSGCLRSVQNNSTDFFSATSTSAASTTSTGLARIAFDGAFKVGTTSAQNVSITLVTANRTTATTPATLTVSGKITNNSGTTLYSPNVCIVVRTSLGNVLITGTTSTIDLASSGTATFTNTITVPNDSTASSVDVWVDGLDAAGNPTTPQSFTGTIVNTGGTANHLGFSVQPVGGGVAGAPFGTNPTVSILDVNGITVTTGTGSTLSVTLAVKAGTGPAGSVLTCASNAVVAVAGVAAFTGCSLNHAGTGIVLTATASITSADSNGISITPGAATKLAFTTPPGGANGGSAFGTQPVVAVQDANGDTVWTDNATVVTLAITTGSGTLTCSPATNAKTVVAGVAAFALCAIDIAGSKSLTATSVPVYTPAVTPLTVSVGAPATLAFTPQPAGAGAGVLATQPVVTVKDAGGNFVTTGVPTLTLTSGTGTLSGCIGVNAGGTVTYSGCSISATGTKTLTATLGGAVITSSSFTI